MTDLRVAAICGRNRDYHHLREAARMLTALGYVVVMPHGFRDQMKKWNRGQINVRDHGQRLQELRIQMADIVVVALPDGHFPFHIAEGVLYARTLGKPVVWLQEPRLVDVQAHGVCPDESERVGWSLLQEELAR